jgi:ferredoxin
MNTNSNQMTGMAIPTGAAYVAKLKFPYCKTSYDCIAACPEKAITIGPERLPSHTCTGMHLLPGKPEIDADKCTGCGDCISVCPNHALEMVSRN